MRSCAGVQAIFAWIYVQQYRTKCQNSVFCGAFRTHLSVYGSSAECVCTIYCININIVYARVCVCVHVCTVTLCCPRPKSLNNEDCGSMRGAVCGIYYKIENMHCCTCTARVSVCMFVGVFVCKSVVGFPKNQLVTSTSSVRFFISTRRDAKRSAVLAAVLAHEIVWVR